MDAEAAISPRKLGPDDLKACLRLDRTCLKGLWTLEQWRRELSESARLVMGVDGDDESLIALASAWLVVDELQITAVAVDPRHQRRGLGAGILLALIQQGRSYGGVKASLEVSATNAAGQGLYAHCGFSTIGRRKGYFANGDDALLQSRAIR